MERAVRACNGERQLLLQEMNWRQPLDTARNCRQGRPLACKSAKLADTGRNWQLDPELPSGPGSVRVNQHAGVTSLLRPARRTSWIGHVCNYRRRDLRATSSSRQSPISEGPGFRNVGRLMRADCIQRWVVDVQVGVFAPGALTGPAPMREFPLAEPAVCRQPGMVYGDAGPGESWVDSRGARKGESTGMVGSPLVVQGSAESPRGHSQVIKSPG